MAAPKLPLAVEHVVRNAAEHNDAADPRVEITARRPATDAGVVEVTVADNGPGIPTDEKEVLLDGEETPLKHGSGWGCGSSTGSSPALGAGSPLSATSREGVG